jgi:hypothetical protein
MSDVLKARICGWGLLLGSISLLVLTGTINYFQGDHFGVSAAGKAIASVSSVAVDIMGLFFCGIAAGICFGIRKWGWGLAFGFAMLLSGGWSINSMYSYQATERISASATREAQNSRVVDADKLTKDSVAKTLSLAAKAKNSTAREDYMYGTQEAIKAFRDAKVDVFVAPDPGAQSIAARLGWKLETVQYLQSGYLAILVIFLKMIGFPGAGFLLSWNPEPTSPVKSSSVPSSPKGGAGGDGESVKSTDASKDKQPAREAEIHRFPTKATADPDHLQPPPKVSADMPRVPAPAPRLPVSLSLQPTYASVEDFLARHPSVTNQKVIADAMGVSQGKVSRDIKRLKGRGKVKVEKNWRSNAVTYTPRRNGGVLHAVI